MSEYCYKCSTSVELLLDGLRAFANASPNMNSLVGFGSIAAFLISAVSTVSASDSCCLDLVVDLLDDVFVLFICFSVVDNGQSYFSYLY